MTVVALTGDGEFYSSGNDMSSFLNFTDETFATVKAMIRAFYTFPKVLICVVNGPCIGIAVTTAVLCDIVYADETVRSRSRDLAQHFSQN